MKKNRFIYITIIAIFSFKGYAQNSKFYVTDKINDKYAYVDVIKTYERVAEKGYKSADLFKKLGDSYYQNAELEQAAKWYCELFAMNNTDLEPKYYYQYAMSLKFIGQIDKANEMLVKLKQKSEAIAEKKNQKQR
ncbi:flagellar motor protein MotB [Flavobacterium sp. ZT3R17]|uniref:flagellar motor protein MotB n=1 Tax=Flavobacterium cryoconiti TaxID=3398736 RepID=UPI003A8B2298